MVRTFSSTLALISVLTLSGCGASGWFGDVFGSNDAATQKAAAQTTGQPPQDVGVARQATVPSLREQVIMVKNECEKMVQTKPQWYRCWIPRAERVHEAYGYPHMDLLKVHFSELTMINNNIEKGVVTPDQGEAMIAQSMVRFNNAVIGREQAVRDREMENWKEFRSYIESAEPADPSLKKTAPAGQ